MSAGELHLIGDLAVEQGANWDLGLTVGAWLGVTGGSVTGFAVEMQARPKAGSTRLLLDLSSEHTTGDSPSSPAITLAAVGADSLGVAVSLLPDATAELDWENGKYDLVVETPSGNVIRLVEGDIQCSKRVTVP